MAYTSLADLRKSRGGFDSLMKEVEKIANPQSESNNRNDDRFWQPEVDKAGNGYAVIRFLAPPKGEELPWVRVWNHGFQGPMGKWYIENSLTTIGKTDPVSEFNTELWNSGSEANKEVARKQKRKLTYYTNILIVQDSKRPENEGKVFLFKFGKKIFDKIKDVAEPQFEDEKPLNLWNKQHSLTAFLDPKNFKSYDDLKKKLDMVLSGGTSAIKKAEEVTLGEDANYVQPATSAARPATAPKAAPTKEVDFDDDDESLSYFSKLASDD